MMNNGFGVYLIVVAHLGDHAPHGDVGHALANRATVWLRQPVRPCSHMHRHVGTHSTQHQSHHSNDHRAPSLTKAPNQYT